jgi:GMP synthase-like glutamine amidotransferase
MRLLLLNCDIDKNEKTNGAAIIERLVHGRIPGVRIKRVDAFGDKLPNKKLLRNYAGVIITGSIASVYERKAWASRLKAFVRQIDLQQIPTFCICFGFQLVAVSFGGKVVRGKGMIEGFMNVRTNAAGEANAILKGMRGTFKAYESHQDITARLPNGAVILARSDLVEIYALRNFFCVQFHPEINAGIARIMAVRDKRDIRKICNGVASNYGRPQSLLLNFVEQNCNRTFSHKR